MAFFPLRLIPDDTTIDFMGKRWWGFAISGALTVGAIVLLLTKGLAMGIDFTGGVLIELRTEQVADLAPMRESLAGQGLGEHALQSFGDGRGVMVRVQLAEGADQAAAVELIKKRLNEVTPGKIDYRSVDFVGPTVGQELVWAGIWATALALVGILLYIWFRFGLRFGFGVVLALVHDVIMTLAFYSVTGFDFGLTSIAAVLTILGYSVNDSVVIYDRIRENLRKFKKMPLTELINKSLNDTLSRSVLTHLTVALCTIALLLVGGEVIRGFSAAMLFGVVVGSYSSIFVSAPVLIYMQPKREAAVAGA